MSQDTQNLEPSIIEYARFYGLTYDHLQDSPLQGLSLPENSASLLDDPPELVHIELTDVKVAEERLTLDAGAASFLSFITESINRPPTPSDEDLGIHRHRIRRMKLELPLLRTDHEIDVIRFASPIVPDLENEFLPTETVDTEEDEGLEWPSSFRALPDKFSNILKSEKIGASKDDFLYLQKTVSCHLEGVDNIGFEMADLSYKKVTKPSLRTIIFLILTLSRKLLQTRHHLHCFHCRQVPNLMYLHPKPAILTSSPIPIVQHEKKPAKSSV